MVKFHESIYLCCAVYSFVACLVTYANISQTCKDNAFSTNWLILWNWHSNQFVHFFITISYSDLFHLEFTHFYHSHSDVNSFSKKTFFRPNILPQYKFGCGKKNHQGTLLRKLHAFTHMHVIDFASLIVFNK